MSWVVSWQHSPANPVQVRAATPAINLTCSQSSRSPPTPRQNNTALAR